MQNTDSATTSGPNAELFVAVLAQIEKHPETWVQNAWRTVRRDDSMYRYVRTDAGGSRLAGLAATDALCIRVHGADLLFAASNTLDDLYRISADLLGIDETTLRDKVAAVVADGATQAVSS